VDADRRAAALLAGLQGGVLIMLATGEIGHLEVALDEGIGALRGTGGAAAGADGAAARMDRAAARTGGSAARDGGRA
jgi:hypothetical protein